MKYAGYVFLQNRGDGDVLVVLNDFCDVMWIPQREGKDISVERRRPDSVDRWIDPLNDSITIVRNPHE